MEHFIKLLRVIKRFIKHWLSFSTYDLIFACNWYNPLATIYLNLRSFPFKQAIKFPIYVYGRPNFYYLTGTMYIRGVIHHGMIKYNYTCIGAPNNMSMQSDLLNEGVITFCGEGIIGTGTKIRVARNAQLEIGEQFKIADQVNIGCYSKIEIGNNVMIVHRCQVLDSNYHYVANLNQQIIPQWKKPIKIGDGCWICNSSSIQGGTILPNNVIVGSYSLVNKDYSNVPEKSLIAGIPAKFIKSGVCRVLNLNAEAEINKFYFEHPNSVFKMEDGISQDYFC